MRTTSPTLTKILQSGTTVTDPRTGQQWKRIHPAGSITKAVRNAAVANKRTATPQAYHKT